MSASHSDPRNGSLPIDSPMDVPQIAYLVEEEEEPVSLPVRRRKSYTLAEKRRTYELSRAYPNAGQKKLARAMGIPAHAIGRTLRDEEYWASTEASAYEHTVTRRKKPVYEALETELAEWLGGKLRKGAKLTDKDIKAEALRIAATLATLGGADGAKLGLFKCSRKWLAAFAARHGFANRWPPDSAPSSSGHARPAPSVCAVKLEEEMDDDEEVDELESDFEPESEEED